VRATNGIPLGCSLLLTDWNCKFRPNAEGIALPESDEEQDYDDESRGGAPNGSRKRRKVQADEGGVIRVKVVYNPKEYEAAGSNPKSVLQAYLRKQHQPPPKYVSSTTEMKRFVSVVEVFGVRYGYGARFPTGICTRGCHWIPRMFA
jgi:hypothetical protein